MSKVNNVGQKKPISTISLTEKNEEKYNLKCVFNIKVFHCDSKSIAHPFRGDEKRSAFFSFSMICKMNQSVSDAFKESILLPFNFEFSSIFKFH